MTQSVHALLCLPEVYQYLADGEPPSIGIAADWLADSGADWSAYGGGLWGLLPVSDAAVPAGLVLLSDYADARMELTYLLHPDHWGSGLATRMAHTVMGRCFKRGQVHTIWAGADKPNVGSINVMQRLGMRFGRDVKYPSGEGVEYVMAASAYQPRRFISLDIIN
ncbi:MAG: GNAT family N-acetyltransferase [Pseudomonadota bacterium]